MRKVLNVLSFLKGEGEGELLKDDDDDLGPSEPETEQETEALESTPEPVKTESATSAPVHASVPVPTIKSETDLAPQSKPSSSTTASHGGKLDTDWYISNNRSDYVDVQDAVLATLVDSINVELSVETKRKLLRRLQNQITFIEEKIISSTDSQLRTLAHNMGLGETIEDIPNGKSRDWTVEFILKYGRAQ